MRFLVAALAALPLTAAAAQPPQAPIERFEPAHFVAVSPDQICPEPLMRREGPGPKADFKNLGDLPPADAYHAVWRVDAQGCLDPVMVGYQFVRGR